MRRSQTLLPTQICGRLNTLACSQCWLTQVGVALSAVSLRVRPKAGGTNGVECHVGLSPAAHDVQGSYERPLSPPA